MTNCPVYFCTAVAGVHHLRGKTSQSHQPGTCAKSQRWPAYSLKLGKVGIGMTGY